MYYFGSETSCRIWKSQRRLWSGHSDGVALLGDLDRRWLERDTFSQSGRTAILWGNHQWVTG